jgi:hypothetical protein
MKYTLMIAASLATLAGSAFGQQTKNQEPALRGPAVEESGVPGEGRQFAPGRARRDRMGAEIPHPLFLRVLGTLRGPEAAEGVRLTAEQSDRVKALDDEFMATRRKFVQEHGPELKELAPKLSPEDRRRLGELLGRDGRPGSPPRAPEKRPPQDQAPMDEGAQNARARLLEILEAAPKPADVHAQMFEVLSKDQKAAFQQSLEKAKGELEKRRAPKTDTPEGGPKQRLKDMTPAEREQAKERLKERRRSEEQGKPARRGKPSPDDK